MPKRIDGSDTLYKNACLALEWLDNLAREFPGAEMNRIVDHMPNNWGGRDALREAIKRSPGLKVPRG